MCVLYLCFHHCFIKPRHRKIVAARCALQNQKTAICPLVTAGECPDKSSTSSEPKNSKIPISLARLAKELVHTLKNENLASADLSVEEEIGTAVEDAGNSDMKTEKKRKSAQKTKVFSPSPFFLSISQGAYLL
ncbi:hypothetical protein CEXT_313251 [Caerostris extrusa]|uniref:Uncharacterized protein n=1 Tax=Caerostris extrusa TaxID=172846 RepID=A0AAV4QG66_CAEEX|nr:hypothetical protein CEXT_313251 [Caerostris extrusa]